MSYYETGSPVYRQVRKLEATDWNHADVFNQTISQAVQNTAALHDAVRLIRNITVPAASWKNNQYKVENSSIKADSLVDIYIASASKEAAQEAEIDGTTVDGALMLSCGTAPDVAIVIDCIMVRNEVTEDAG